MSLAFGVSILSPSSLLAHTSSDIKNNHSNKKDALKKKAKDYFYANMYSSSESIYKDLLLKYKNDITIYDGLSKVYLAQFKVLDCVSLFDSGLRQNKHNPLFYDRYAKVLIIMSMGYSNLEENYLKSTTCPSAIHQAIDVLIESILLFPDKKYLREHLLDARKSLELKNLKLKGKNKTLLQLDNDVSNKIIALTDSIHSLWDNSRSGIKRKAKENTNFEINDSLKRIELKKRRELYLSKDKLLRSAAISNKKKLICMPLFEKYIAVRDCNEAKKIYDLIVSVDKTDTHCKGELINLYSKERKFDELINLYESDNLTLSSFWSIIGLGNAYVKKGDSSGQASCYEKALALYRGYQDKVKNFSAYNCQVLSYSIAKVYFKLNRQDECRTEIIRVLSLINEHSYISLLLSLYAESFVYEDKTKTEEILLASAGITAISDHFVDPIKIYIQNYMSNVLFLNKVRRTQSITIKSKKDSTDIALSSHSLPVLYSLAKYYKKQGNYPSYNEMVSVISEIDNKSPFAKRNI